MTALNCRCYETRMRVAYIADAYYAKYGKPFPTDAKPDNTVTRIFQMLADNGHPYMQMWGDIEMFHKSQQWDLLSDPELDNIYKLSMSTVGYTINGITIRVDDMIESRKRWNDALWTRYEYKRRNRHTVGGAFGKLAVLVWPLAAYLRLSLFIPFY